MGLNGIHKHAISSVSNKITFLCDLYLSMSSLTMWVFDLSSSLDFLSLLFLTNYSRLYQKRYIVGTSIIENFFNVVSWSTIRKWKKVALLAVDLQFGPDECFHFPISKRCEYHNFIFNVKGIANMNSCDKSNVSIYSGLYWHLRKTSSRNTIFLHIIFMLSYKCWSS